MASVIDVAPSSGHNLLTTQVGVAGGYDAIDLRRVSQAGPQQGVHMAGGWKVGEHTPNAMQVDVYANVDLATIVGTTIGYQGYYVVPPHAAVANLDVAASHATLPRIDQVILRAYDHTVDGSGLNTARLMVITGTATAGATLDNRNGAVNDATLGSFIRLADILVPAASATVTNANIRDRRPWAFGLSYRVVRTSADMVPSAGPNEFGAGNFKFRAEFTGNPLLITFQALANQATPDNSLVIGPWFNGGPVDGATQGGQQRYQVINTPAGLGGTAAIDATFVVIPSAQGSNLVSLWQQHTNAVTIYSNANQPAIMFARELIGSPQLAAGIGMFNGST